MKQINCKSHQHVFCAGRVPYTSSRSHWSQIDRLHSITISTGSHNMDSIEAIFINGFITHYGWCSHQMKSAAKREDMSRE